MAQKKKQKVVIKKESELKGKNFLSRSNVLAIIIIVVIAGFFVINNFFEKNEPKVEYYTFKKEGELTFTDSLGNTKTKIDLEIADNEYKRQLGLMNRKSMEENQGMIFIFPQEAYQSFWMRNTLIPLDMIFVNKDHKIITIHKNTKVLSAQSYPSTAPAMYVVEVTGGFTDRHNIILGDKVYWMRIEFNSGDTN
jgi:uncharacterized protein